MGGGVGYEAGVAGRLKVRRGGELGSNDGGGDR